MIFSDDVGPWNVSAYHRGMMGGRTPNIDRIASEGALFTDYYAQQSCMQDKLWAFMPAQVVVGQFLQSFKEFPPSQKSGSFGIGQALEAIQGAGR